MEERKKVGKGCAAEATRSGRKIDFLGYQFTREATYLRKSIKQTFARKMKNLHNEKRRKEVLASYNGWCRWGNCRHLWNTITNNDMTFKQRGITSLTTTKDGRRFFDEPEKKMMEILNTPITIIDFETGVKTANGGDRYVVRFTMMEDGNTEPVRYKVIVNSYKLKSVLDQAREFDNRLKELQDMKTSAMQRFGKDFDIRKMGLAEEELQMLEDNTPIFPQETRIHRRSIGDGKYDYYFE